MLVAGVVLPGVLGAGAIGVMIAGGVVGKLDGGEVLIESLTGCLRRCFRTAFGACFWDGLCLWGAQVALPSEGFLVVNFLFRDREAGKSGNDQGGSNICGRTVLINVLSMALKESPARERRTSAAKADL
jgi:hypothetical protein